MSDNLSRRDFLKKSAIATGTVLTVASGINIMSAEKAEAAPAQSVLAIGSKGSIAQRLEKALSLLGGIGKFVKKGNSVVIKPNFAWERTPEQAANTNPELITALINMCRNAGASRVTVAEYPCDKDVAKVFQLCGANKAVRDAKGRLVCADKATNYREINIPKGSVLKKEDCIKEILDADVFINVPIAKVHGAAEVTASMKNLMGATFNRRGWHGKDLHQCIADYSTAVKPNLIILDAIRVLLTNGPKGPGQTKDIGEVIAGTDPVAIDSYAVKLLDKDLKDVKYIGIAEKLGLGTSDLSKVKILKD